MNSRRRHVGVISVGGERDVANNRTTGSERWRKMSRMKDVEIETAPKNIVKYGFLLAFQILKAISFISCNIKI